MARTKKEIPEKNKLIEKNNSKNTVSGKPAAKPDPDQSLSVPDTGLPVAAKKRGRPKGTKNKIKTTRLDSTVQTISGENTKYIDHDMKLFNLPIIDVNNLQQVKQRVKDYFSICSEDDIKPSVASLAIAFGISRFTLFNWINENSGRIKQVECRNTLKQAYDLINSYYEHMMNNGKINPVAGIFLMKNNMGYKDTTDHVITANNDNVPALSDITERAGLLD